MNLALIAEFVYGDCKYLLDVYEQDCNFEILEEDISTFYKTKTFSGQTLYYLGLLETVKLIRNEIYPDKYNRLYELSVKYSSCLEGRSYA